MPILTSSRPSQSSSHNRQPSLNSSLPQSSTSRSNPSPQSQPQPHPFNNRRDLSDNNPVSPASTSVSSAAGGYSFSAYGYGSGSAGGDRGGSGYGGIGLGNGPSGSGSGARMGSGSGQQSANLSRSTSSNGNLSNTNPYMSSQSQSHPHPPLPSQGHTRQQSSSSQPSAPLTHRAISGSGSATGSASGGITFAAKPIINGIGDVGGSSNKSQEKLDQAREVARRHFRALRGFLSSWLENESPTTRASAREKLTRLTRSQFQELSTDVFDELVRRTDVENGSGKDDPFLPVREDFHPKRNQARQKLATLPKNRFKDLGSDVFYELRRRWPEFEEEMKPSPPSPPSAYPVTANNIHDNLASRMGDTSSNQNQFYSSQARGNDRGPSPSNNPNERIQPGPARRPSQVANSGGMAGSKSQAALTSLSGTTTNEVVVPNKSTMTEERIEVPYAQEGRESLLLGDDSEEDTDMRNRSNGSFRPDSRGSNDGRNGMGRNSNSGRSSLSTDKDRYDPSSSSDVHSRKPSLSRIDEIRPHMQQSLPPQMSRSRTDPSQDSRSMDQARPPSGSSHATTVPAGGTSNGEAMVNFMRERKARADAEAKVSGLEKRLAALEKEASETGKREEWERSRTRELEEEVRGHKERSASHANELRSMQRELESHQSQLESEQRSTAGRRREEQLELQTLRERCQQAEQENNDLKAKVEQANQRGNGDDNAETIKELQNELIVLMEELKSLSIRNEDLMAEKEDMGQTIRQLESESESYKRKWETTKTQLRNMKATSTMFISKPLSDDHLPATPDGNIADIHVSAFQSAIDGLLAVARSSQPSGVLPAMKAVVEALSDISEDVKAYERSPNFPIDTTQLDTCKHQSAATLNALMQAARNHGISSGLSPIGLLDAAAGHAAANVVEIIKLLKIRKTVQARGSNSSFGRKSFSEMSAKRSTSGSGVMERLEVMRDPGRASISESEDSSYDTTAGSGNRRAFPLGGANNGSSTPMRMNRADSVMSSSSLGQQSDAFDLDRKASFGGNNQKPYPPFLDTSSANQHVPKQIDIPSGGPGSSIPRPGSAASGFSAGGIGPGQNRATTPHEPWVLVKNGEENGRRASPAPTASTETSNVGNGRGNEQEREEGEQRRQSGDWEEVKPYLSTQSSALVNSIQHLLAQIRNGNTPNSGSSVSALNDHLSEVIAIGSSIVAVASGVLPTAADGPDGAEAQRLLNELMNSTDKLSQHQSTTEFTKAARQEIASAAFGMAKALRGLMKVQ